MHLTQPHARNEASFRQALGEMETERERISWIYLGEQYEDFYNTSFADYVARALHFNKHPPAGYVCGTTLWAVENAEVIGRVGIRHELNEFLAREGGHIGYIVRPSFRGQGFGTLMLKQALETDQARTIGRLLVTCDEDNMASEKIILKNGGVLENIVEVGPDKPRKKRFWIEVE
ncbi:MAG: GNAT family N-acetyltransferase [Planctomycetaceae bacterium]|nr:GNAT family N-acetyltransferase [Planctomycetaceae bacterium]